MLKCAQQLGQLALPFGLQLMQGQQQQLCAHDYVATGKLCGGRKAGTEICKTPSDSILEPVVASSLLTLAPLQYLQLNYVL